MLSKSLVMPLCVLLAASALASNFDNNQEDDYEENSNALGFSRERRFNALSSDKKKYCGERLYAMVRMICQARGKRQAIPEPAYPGNLSPFLMSIYRPIMDEDNLITENWEQWKLESPSSRDRFQKISMLRNLQKRAINMGISDVCCRHQCSLQDIARFC